MSLRPDVIAGFANQLHVTLIGIVFLPIYVRLAGPIPLTWQDSL